MPNQSPAPDPLSKDELLALWDQARALARRWCARSLARLRAGQGGFYQEDDFWQELFLEFWDLARAWRRGGADQSALWDEWRRRLRRSGERVLKRAPQRLWDRAEQPTDPGRAASLADGLAESDDLLDTREAPGPRSDDLNEVGAWTLALDASVLAHAAQALSALGPAQRQMIYMTKLAELPVAQVAHDLGLPDAHSVYRRVLLAREALPKRACLAPQALGADRRLGADHLLAALDQERRQLSGLVESGYSLKEASRWLASWQDLGQGLPLSPRVATGSCPTRSHT